MCRLMDITVLSGLVIAWRLATWPTNRSPSLVNATTDGVVRFPSAFGMTVASPPSMTDMQELVVPKSIPRTLLIVSSFCFAVFSYLDHARSNHFPVDRVALLKIL